MKNVRTAKVKLLRVDTIYHDGRHNAFTSIVRWRDRYWVCFRNASTHRSHDGKILVISSPDLATWSKPSIPIDTAEDNRDPKLFVFRDRLYLSSLTVSQAFEDERNYSGRITVHDFFSFISFTDDGIHWAKPHRAWEPFKSIWWVAPVDDHLYGTGYPKQAQDGKGSRFKRAEFIASTDGLAWNTVSTISEERQASECALAFLPDKRAVAFVRHDEDHIPEIKVSSPPYTRWEKLFDFKFRTNGPCLGMVDNTVVASSRAMLDQSPPEIVRMASPGSTRGLLIMAIDIERRMIVPELVLSCPHAPEGDHADVSYAGITNLGEGQFVMSYYEGLKMGYSDIRLARLQKEWQDSLTHTQEKPQCAVSCNHTAQE